VEGSRSRARRVKALWTLYTTLTYLLYALIIILVLGPQNWSWPHYGGLVGAPVVIYGVRQAITSFFDWRISRKESYLDSLQKQRESKIAELKKATKYDSTYELLQKYGDVPPKQSPRKPLPQGTKRKINAPPEQPPSQRTGIAPPPTANIPGRVVGPPATPQPPTIDSRQISPIPPGRTPLSSPMLAQSPVNITPDEPGFAPNAFSSAPPPSSSAYDRDPQWYDRILDVLLGEDETAAKSRLALICSSCRLVNGLAPPGVRTLEELGKWRCSSCGAWNGQENEGTKALKEMAERSKLNNGEDWEKVDRSDEADDDSNEPQGEQLSDIAPPIRGTTGRDDAEQSGLTKRVTRSAAKKPSFESSE